MKEKDFDKTITQEETKLEWTAPKLYCLDKGKTEGGPAAGLPEGTTYSGDVS